MRNFKLTSLALLLMGGVILNSCSKDNNGGGDNPNNPAGQSLSADYQYKIVFTTAKAIGEKITFGYDASTKEEFDNVWVDFNNNGIREKGEFSPRGGSVGIGIVGSQTITIYGKITGLNLFDKYEITSIDTSKNSYLEELRIEDSPIKTLDLTHNPNIKKVYVTYKFIEENIKGGLKSLSISADKNPKLETIELSAEGMKTLDISNFPKLKRFLLGGHGSVENLKITNNPNIDDLNSFRGINIKKIEIRNNAKLNLLSIIADKIESIDVSDSPDLKYLGISLLDVNNSALLPVKLLNTPKLTKFNIVGTSTGTGTEPFDISFCVQVDAHRVNNIPKDWSKSRYDNTFKQRTTINYQSTPCP